jgi:hypothetical protein
MPPGDRATRFAQRNLTVKQNLPINEFISTQRKRLWMNEMARQTNVYVLQERCFNIAPEAVFPENFMI